MSQKSSFPHPTDSVQYVLTSDRFVMGVDNSRDRARRRFGGGVANALYGTLQLQLGEPPGTDLRRYHYLCRRGFGGARRADSSVAGSGASPPVDRPARSRSTGSWSPRKFVRRHFPPGDAANRLKKPKLHNVKRS